MSQFAVYTPSASDLVPVSIWLLLALLALSLIAYYIGSSVPRTVSLMVGCALIAIIPSAVRLWDEARRMSDASFGDLVIEYLFVGSGRVIALVGMVVAFIASTAFDRLRGRSTHRDTFGGRR